MAAVSPSLIQAFDPHGVKYFVGGPRFRDDKDFLASQAADLYAFDCRWGGRGQISGLAIPLSKVDRRLQAVPSKDWRWRIPDLY